MMNCKQATQLLSQAQDRKLKLAENVSLKVHTSMCKGCRNFGTQMQQLSRLSNQFVKPNPKPDT